jgi:CubicO group peptidase (beta-lactamase class C family)
MIAPRALVTLLFVTLASSAGCSKATGPDAPPDTDGNPLPGSLDIYSWTQAERIARFPKLDSIFPSQVVRRGAAVRDLPAGTPLPIGADGERTLNDFITTQGVAGLLVLQDGRIRLERYALGQTASSRWTSFSVAKSLTSLLVGAALRDGSITSLDAPITNYITELRGSAYEGVTVRHLITMTSGVAWNEDYSDPNSDIRRFTQYKPVPGLDANVGFVRTLRREAPPGTKWLYKTPETNLLGTLLIAATSKPLGTYLSEKIWAPYGMDRDATWLNDHVGHAQGGCCLQATLRDFGRIGQFVLDGARVNGQSIVPVGWIETSTRKQWDIGVPGRGYGYQWWTTDAGPFEARGIYGQLIHIDPARRLVVVILGSWLTPTAGDSDQLQRNLITSLGAALDAEAAGR